MPREWVLIASNKKWELVGCLYFWAHSPQNISKRIWILWPVQKLMRNWNDHQRHICIYSAIHTSYDRNLSSKSRVQMNLSCGPQAALRGKDRKRHNMPALASWHTVIYIKGAYYDTGFYHRIYPMESGPLQFQSLSDSTFQVGSTAVTRYLSALLLTSYIIDLILWTVRPCSLVRPII